MSAIAQCDRRPLFIGSKLRCPHDGKLRNLLAYNVFERAQEFEHELNPVLRCPDCGHIFSPGFSEKELAELMRHVY